MEFEYTKINKWTYIHHGEFTSWHNSGFPLGNAYGPDVESLDFKSVISTSNRYDILIDLGYLIKGSNDILVNGGHFQMIMMFKWNIFTILFQLFLIKDGVVWKLDTRQKTILTIKILNSLGWMPAPSIYAKLLYTNQKEITLK